MRSEIHIFSATARESLFVLEDQLIRLPEFAILDSTVSKCRSATKFGHILGIHYSWKSNTDLCKLSTKSPRSFCRQPESAMGATRHTNENCPIKSTVQGPRGCQAQSFPVPVQGEAVGLPPYVVARWAAARAHVSVRHSAARPLARVHRRERPNGG